MACREEERREPAGLEFRRPGRAGRAHQSRAPELPDRLRAGGHGGAALEEHARHRRMAARRGPHQRRLAPRRLGRVDLRAAVEERFHRRRVSGVRTAHQRRLAGVQARVGVGPRFEQAQHGRRAAAGAGGPERRGAEVVGRVDVGAGLDEPIDDPGVVAVRRPVEGRGAVPLGGVGVRSLLEEPGDGFRVPLLRCFHDAQVRGGALGAPRAAQGQPPSRRRNAPSQCTEHGRGSPVVAPIIARGAPQEKRRPRGRRSCLVGTRSARPCPRPGSGSGP